LTSSGRPLVAWLVPSALLAYAAFALGVARWWISVVAIRGVATHRWPVLAFAAAAVGLMQTRAARRAWPRLRPGHTRAGRIC
jgi:4-amino-4-deoxy-L-arabinose transferase-like glycosyltransferase